MVKSQENKLSSSAEAMTAKAQRLSERGVDYYRSFLNQYRAILVAESDCKRIRNEMGQCQDQGSEKSFANAEHIANIEGDTERCNPSVGGPPGQKATEVINEFETVTERDYEGRSLDDAGYDGENGTFKLVSYKYDDSARIGTLTVDGFSGQSKYRAQVQMPIRLGTNNGAEVRVNGTPPGIWAQYFDDRIYSPFHAYIVDSSECLDNSNYPNGFSIGRDAGGRYEDPEDLELREPLSGNGLLENKPVGFPSLPNDGDYKPPLGSNINNLDAITSSDILPRSGDKATDGTVYPASPEDATFIYHLQGNVNGDSIKINGPVITLGQTGKETIRIYADKKISLEGDSRMEPFPDPSAPTNFTKVVIYANDNVSLRGQDTSHKVTDFQVYVYGNRTIKLEGNREFKGFIFGPYSTMRAKGDFGIPALFSGAAWVQKYATPSSNQYATFYQTLTEADLSELEVEAKSGVPTYKMEPIQSFRQISGE
jgi:hypothetical protein